MKIQGFDARSYDRIVTLIAPGLRSRSPFKAHERAEEAGGFLWVIFNNSSIELALHSHRGVLTDFSGWTGPNELQAFAERHKARIAVAVERSGFERFLTRWGARTDLQDSLIEQWLIIAENIREVMEEKALYVWPALWPAHWPRPTTALIETTFSMVFPKNKSAFVLLYDEHDKLDTAMVLVRDDTGAFTHCLGPELLKRNVTLGSGSFVTDSQAVKRWVEAKYEPVHVAFASKTLTIHELLRTPQSAQWLGAINNKSVHLDGNAPWLLAAITASAAQAVLQTARGWLGSFMKKRDNDKPAENPRPRWTTELFKAWSGILQSTSESSSTLEE